MKKLLLMLAAVAALAVTAQPAAAQAPASAAGCTQCADPGYGGYGYGGFLSKGKSFGGGWFGGKLHGLFTNHGGNGGGPQNIQAVDPRSGNAGQLAFPQNPFIRGPRDYFMWDER